MSQKTTWAIDPTHTEIGFKVKHMMFTNVSGKIGTYTATITTGNADRDAHLLSADFFDAAKFSTLHFVATSLKKIDGTDFELTGNLTIHGVTKAVTLAAEFGGLMKDPWGNIKAGFNISGKIN